MKLANGRDADQFIEEVRDLADLSIAESGPGGVRVARACRELAQAVEDMQMRRARLETEVKR